MPFTIENLRQRIGLQPTDNSRDADLILAQEMAMSLAERYCDRGFEYKLETELFTHVSGGTISLYRYPVDQIITLDVINGGARAYHLEPKTGLIHFDGDVHEHEITVEYMGGFNPMPPDLMLALLQIFDAVWPLYSGSGGGGPMAGNIESVTLTGVGTIRYGAGIDSSDDSGSASPYIGAAASILSLYKREYC